MAGFTILIAEDEPLIAMMLEDFLAELGHRVAGVADSVARALDRVSAADFDIAILDVRLRDGETCWPVADALADRGIAFLIATGGHVEPAPERHAGAPRLAKPFTMEGVRAALEAVEGRASA